MIQKRETGSQQEDAHPGKCLETLSDHVLAGAPTFDATYDERQSTATLGIDQEQGWNGEDDLHGSVAQRCVQSLSWGVVRIRKDGRAVEGDNCRSVSDRVSFVGRVATYC